MNGVYFIISLISNLSLTSSNKNKKIEKRKLWPSYVFSFWIYEPDTEEKSDITEQNILKNEAEEEQKKVDEIKSTQTCSDKNKETYFSCHDEITKEYKISLNGNKEKNNSRCRKVNNYNVPGDMISYEELDTNKDHKKPPDVFIFSSTIFKDYALLLYKFSETNYDVNNTKFIHIGNFALNKYKIFKYSFFEFKYKEEGWNLTRKNQRLIFYNRFPRALHYILILNYDEEFEGKNTQKFYKFFQYHDDVFIQRFTDHFKKIFKTDLFTQYSSKEEKIFKLSIHLSYIEEDNNFYRSGLTVVKKNKGVSKIFYFYSNFEHAYKSTENTLCKTFLLKKETCLEHERFENYIKKSDRLREGLPHFWFEFKRTFWIYDRFCYLLIHGRYL